MTAVCAPVYEASPSRLELSCEEYRRYAARKIREGAAADFCCATTGLFHDPQLISHLEDAGNRVSGDGGQVLVGLAIHDASEGDALIVHNDVDTGRSRPEITRKPSGTGECCIRLLAHLIVERGGRKNLDVVNYLIHSFNVLERVFGVGPGCGMLASDVSAQGHGAALNAEFKVVEQRVPREHQQFVADLLGNLRFYRVLVCDVFAVVGDDRPIAGDLRDGAEAQGNEQSGCDQSVHTFHF